MSWFWVFPTLVILFVSSIFVLTMFTESETSYEYESCAKLKECIILDIGCIKTTTNNSLFKYDWTIVNNQNLNDMKRAYKIECLFNKQENEE